MIRLLSDAAKAVDARSSRSRQRKVGASEIGVCRKRAAFSHHGHKPSNPENITGLAAIHGTWTHTGALRTMNKEWGALIETVVENDILRGHVDALFLDYEHLVKLPAKYAHPEPEDVCTVDDLKTKRDGRMVDYVRNRGPKRSELFQTHLYASLLRQGKIKPLKRQQPLADLGPIPIERVRLRYIARTGEDGAEYPYEQPYDPEIAAEAWDWVDQVARSSSPDDVPRDQDGPGLSVVCDNCPFRTACWGESDDYAPQSKLIVTDADLAAVLAEYDEARTIEREAKARKDMARATLDATEKAIYTDGSAAFKLGWSGGGTGEPKVDVNAMIALFKEAGIEIPYLEPRPTARSIQVTRWQLPVEAECGKPVGDPRGYSSNPATEWLQDRPRGGWTLYSKGDGTVLEELTMGAFKKAYPEYVDPRPPCILKAKHSGDCVDEMVQLDVEPDFSQAEVA